MKTLNKDYINSKFVNAILINEGVSGKNETNGNIDLKYCVLYQEELFEIKFEEINHSKFIQVPAIRLIETIEAEAEYIINNGDKIEYPVVENKADYIINSGKTIEYFEAEKDIRYLINLDNIIKVQKLDTQIWKVTMVDDIYYFKAFPVNMNMFINRLHA